MLRRGKRDTVAGLDDAIPLGLAEPEEFTIKLHEFVIRHPSFFTVMMNPAPVLKIALVGDQSPNVKAHAAIPKALALATRSSHVVVEETWLGTVTLNSGATQKLRGFDGIWCVPGSPYASMDGALNAIRFARENKVPFLGTCGGSQHALIEYCRNVLGLADADHAESNPHASFPLIALLPCALRETESRIRLTPGSRAAEIYGRTEIIEPFNCGFGLNPAHQELFKSTALKITGWGDDGIARVFELTDRPFFIATLFQPERSAFNNILHPLITAFLNAAQDSIVGQPAIGNRQSAISP